jgi:hypothetical protein
MGLGPLFMNFFELTAVGVATVFAVLAGSAFSSTGTIDGSHESQSDKRVATGTPLRRQLSPLHISH